ncbi:hypothetical protein [Tateyamaria sp.]|uniref:hypothetical protein n=1 Tax=Tateyamaria sp. TaxID=1929288 RepID=UPI003B20E063
MSEADCIQILNAHGVEGIEFLSVEDLRASVLRVVFVDDAELSGDQADQGDDEPTVPVKLKFDAWTADGRCKKGETVPMPVSDAAKLIDEGKAERADPLPRGSA